MKEHPNSGVLRGAEGRVTLGGTFEGQHFGRNVKIYAKNGKIYVKKGESFGKFGEKS